MNIKAYIFFTAIAVSGCATIKQVELPDTVNIPASFTSSSADTTSVNRLSWKQFFTDENLVRLIDTALQNNYDLKSAVQRIMIARANTQIANAARLPFVNAGGSIGVDKYGRYTLNGVGNFDTNLSPNISKNQKIPTSPTTDYFVGFRSSWEADIWGKLKDRKRAAYTRYLASEKGRQWLVTQIVSQVAGMYYELLALDNQLKTVQRNIGLQRKALEIVEAQMSGGRATMLAVRQFKAQMLHTQGAEVEISQAIVRTENELNSLLGRFPKQINRDTSFTDKVVPQRIQAGIPSEVLLRRPDIQQAELELIAAKADISAARKAFLPSFTINPYVGLNAFKLPLLFSGGSVAAGIVGSLAGPIINRGVIKGDFAIANAQQADAFYNYQKNIVNGYQEVVTQIKAIENFNKAYELKQAEVAELAEGVATANDLYLAGYASYLEVIVAQGSVLQAEMEQTNLKKESFNSMINLFRSLGGGWE
ncbi:MAG: efflux transporter outer rane subunit [Segetibacter sp.]|nr:efflux transporter outer rane subunit [Segetibacter sp.]